MLKLPPQGVLLRNASTVWGWARGGTSITTNVPAAFRPTAQLPQQAAEACADRGALSHAPASSDTARIRRRYKLSTIQGAGRVPVTPPNPAPPGPARYRTGPAIGRIASGGARRC